MGRGRGRRWIVAVLALVALTEVGAVATPAEAAPQPELGTADWRMVSAGGRHTCGIRTTGRLYCWGLDNLGQLGNGGSNANEDTPTEVAGGFTDWTTVTATSGGYACGRRATGRLYCWGGDTSGQLGDGGTNTEQDVPTEVAGGFTNWTAVAAGDSTTCGRRATGRLYCWGNDFYGQLGNGGANAEQTTPVLVSGGATDWTAVTVGGSHACGRRASGKIYCWGRDLYGQLGNGGANTDRGTPGLVAGAATNWTSVTAGGDHTCGRRANSRLYCWGRDLYGQLGNGGANTDRGTPGLVAGAAADWTAVDTGADHTCGRRANARLYCWGHDFYSQLGNGGADADRAVPTQIVIGAANWSAVDAGDRHTCGRRNTRRLYCWGSDDDSQLGDGGSDTDQAAPVQVEA
jgi:alpha-tubulin suppressor-like RCC1 family protein